MLPQKFLRSSLVSLWDGLATVEDTLNLSTALFSFVFINVATLSTFSVTYDFKIIIIIRSIGNQKIIIYVIDTY